MKRLTTSVLAGIGLLIVHGSLIFAVEVHEIKSIAESEKYVDSETLFLFDIDNTVMMPAQTLGGEEWFDYRVESSVKKAVGEGTPVDVATTQAIETALKEWNSVQMITKSVAAEEKVGPEFLQKMQQKKTVIMALTARPDTLAKRTEDQLDSVGITPRKTTFWQDDVRVKEGMNAILYTKGLLLVGPGNSKGEALRDFLTKIDKTPSKIVFVDNKGKHLVTVGDAVEKMGIGYVGLRLGATDEKIANFNPKIADVQLAHFLTNSGLPNFKIMSDYEARTALRLK